MSIGSYPSIYNLGHAAIADLLLGDVLCQEKVDGSQISFGLSLEGELMMRSKGKELNLADPDKMFALGVENVRKVQHLLTPGYVYRGEYLAKPKHNTLKYDRTPTNNIVVFDIQTNIETYMNAADREVEVARLGFDSIPSFFVGKINSVEQFRALLDQTSYLGGAKIEGVVIKPVNYDLFGKDKKALMGKYVSEDFKESHRKGWAEANPQQGDVVQIVASNYRTNARFRKAYEHLRDRGEITHTPQDIGLFMKEIPEDVQKECADEIKEALFLWAWPKIKRELTKGAPQFYKELLMQKQFAETDDGSVV